MKFALVKSSGNHISAGFYSERGLPIMINGMKKLLPKAWLKQFFLSDNGGERKGIVELYFRIGKFMSNDDNGALNEKIYILPCLCFHFNHSELCVQFAWINIFYSVLWKDWQREDCYKRKMINIELEKWVIGHTY